MELVSLLYGIPFVIGLVVAAVASRRAVIAAITASQAANVSAGLIGVTVLAVGTDLPEIANSIISALSGHGDVNVGDSAGSALTQVTLVLAILCATAVLRADQRVIATLGGLTVIALLLVALLLRDGVFSRLDGLLLVTSWIVGLLAARHVTAPVEVLDAAHEPVAPHLLAAMGWLTVVAIASTIVVQSFVELTEAIGVPELVASAVVLALGTSLPELVVDVTALRRGAAALALGDLFGSSLLDATLAIGSGPVIRATTVSGNAPIACVIAAGGIAVATLVITRKPEHRHGSAALLLGTYGVATAAMILATS
jgi:cation:H+ antiporter